MEDLNQQTHAPSRDPLTGLYQQDYLFLALERILRHSEKHDVAATLGLLQLENFYEIRSWVGKSEANLLLNEIAGILRKTLPPKALLCRCRHYEFGILLLKDCSVNAQLITQKVKQALLCAASSSIPPQLELKCAVGLASVDKAVPTAEVMFARARHNLSVSLSKNDSPVDMPAINPDEALSRLREALQHNLLTIYYQPWVALKEDGLRHYELRCRHRHGEKVLPGKLMMEAAVKNALGGEIDKMLVSHGLTLLAKRENQNLRLYINISHNSLVKESFYYWLKVQLATHATPLSSMVFQVREIDVLIAQHHMAQFCERLESLGIQLSISHFASTAEPFSYLSLLNAHFAKLDVSLLKGLNCSQERLDQLQKTCKSAQQRGLKVVASRVEDICLLPVLWRSGIDFVEGSCLQGSPKVMDFQFLQQEKLLLPND